MAYALEYCVELPLHDVRERVREVLLHHGYAVQFHNGDHGTAERGSSWKESAFGFLARHLRFRIRLSEGTSITVIQLERETSGWVEGLLGVTRNGKEVERVRDALCVSLDAPCLIAV